MKQIKTIIFDLGGVLVDFDRERCIKAFAELGYHEADKLLNSYKQEGIFLQLEEGKITPRVLHSHICDTVGHHIDGKLLDAALHQFMVKIPDYKLDMILELRQQGYKIFMLSNTNIIMIEWAKQNYFTQQGLTIDHYFDRLFLSFEMGVVKPDADIYHKMIADSGINPGEALFIDDAAVNIEVAQKLGFNTYLASEKEDFRHIFATYKPLK